MSHQCCEATAILVLLAKLYVRLYGTIETYEFNIHKKIVFWFKGNEDYFNDWTFFFLLKMTLKYVKKVVKYALKTQTIRLVFYTDNASERFQ